MLFSLHTCTFPPNPLPNIPLPTFTIYPHFSHILSLHPHLLNLYIFLPIIFYLIISLVYTLITLTLLVIYSLVISCYILFFANILSYQNLPSLVHMFPSLVQPTQVTCFVLLSPFIFIKPQYSTCSCKCLLKGLGYFIL